MCTFSCSDEEIIPDPEPEKDYVTGKNMYTTLSDGDEREYYVHVQQNYDENSPTPMVFMLHGSSGNGEKFYNIGGWKEVGETENILTVFPSSMQVCIIEDGQVKNTTKWNIYGGFIYCDGYTPSDDIKFLRQVITEMKNRFNVDSKRIYLAGFSNGGAMAARCSVEMSDVLAAVVESAGSFARDTVIVPQGKIPVTFQLGNVDSKWLVEGIEEYPLDSLELMLNNFSSFQKITNTHTNIFDLEKEFTISGTSGVAAVATFKSNTPTPPREFQFILIEGLGHNYPNGTNHPIKGAVLNWQWMKQYSLP
jgi:polyhydroxybutyrate depolymerase